ncbi:MAG: hypothetical protein IPG42_12120 [Betaproteobacteria bacterium]|nr:hypothetical protein [Betaproteobacteria bacterium]
MLDAWKQTFASMGLDPRLVKAATLADSVQREVERKAGTSDAAWTRLSARLTPQLTAERQGRSRTDTQILDELLTRDAYFLCRTSGSCCGKTPGLRLADLQREQSSIWTSWWKHGFGL